jgi:two-component system, NarL family, response regulator NreC
MRAVRPSPHRDQPFVRLARVPGERSVTVMAIAPTGPKIRDAGRSAATDAIRVVLAEDHARMRGSLRMVLEHAPGITVCAEAGDLALTRQHLLAHRPDVLVLDLNMRDGSSLAMVSELRMRLHGARVVIISMEDSPQFAKRALAAGASGYILKDHADEELPEAVLATARGREYVSARIASQLSRSRQALTRGRLSARETEVLRLIALGHTSQEAAAALEVSPRTIETHRANIHRKLAVRTRAQLVGYALRCGLLAR